MVAQLPQKLAIFAGVAGDEWSQGLYRGTPSEAYERGLGHTKSVPKRERQWESKPRDSLINDGLGGVGLSRTWTVANGVARQKVGGPGFLCNKTQTYARCLCAFCVRDLLAVLQSSRRQTRQ